jgi:hypothetical protein
MSKFDAVYNQIKENSNILGIPSNNQNQQQNSNQSNAADPLDELSGQLAKINDPQKIKQMLAALMQPQQPQSQQQKPITNQPQSSVPNQ